MCPLRLDQDNKKKFWFRLMKLQIGEKSKIRKSVNTRKKFNDDNGF